MDISKISSDRKQFVLPALTINKLPKDKKYKLLDVGSCDCDLKNFLTENIEYYSLDCTQEYAKHDYIHDLDKFPIPIKDNQFDIIVCLETLEHTLYPDRVMKELLRLGKKDAIFFLSIPNEYNLYCRLNYLFGRKTENQETFQLAEKHLHVQVPRVKDILKFFSQYLKIEKIDYRWLSRTGGRSSGLKKSVFLFLDRIINFLAKIYPSMFARTVVVMGRRKDQ
jgi:2-polyprenyl-3-methyl-5-hydroxy-6-metoxy-1,4-benzoquinol methylase